MHIVDKVEEFANKHMEDIIAKENVTPDCVELLGELMDIVKDASEYRKNESTTYAMDSYGSDATMDYTRRYADSNGGYNHYGRRMPYNNTYGDREHIIHKMENMLMDAQSEEERRVIQDCINRLNK